MELVRNASGSRSVLRAFASQVHPVFMLPPVAATWFGAIVAGEFAITIGLVHMVAIFFAVYTAHVKDGYIDFHHRGEDDDHPLTIQGCHVGLAGATLGFALCLGILWIQVNIWAVAITFPTWVIGYLHAPQLDTNPVTTTLGYPTGIALAILGGYYVQATAIGAPILGYAMIFLVTLAGIKIIDDEQDYEYDRSIGKGSVSVVLGRSRARALAFLLLLFGIYGVLWGTVTGLFPASAPLAAFAFGAVIVLAYRARAKRATMLLIRGGYVFLALLIVAVWFQPLAWASLPDITHLGPYTYLATELFFGGIALGLLLYANALWKAIRTILALYPIAYLWDWYTLEVGVFEITMRTGYELFGIPIEEQLFMIVVPALVIGIHESLGKLSRRAAWKQNESP